VGCSPGRPGRAGRYRPTDPALTDAVAGAAGAPMGPVAPEWGPDASWGSWRGDALPKTGSHGADYCRTTPGGWKSHLPEELREWVSRICPGTLPHPAHTRSWYPTILVYSQCTRFEPERTEKDRKTALIRPKKAIRQPMLNG